MELSLLVVRLCVLDDAEMLDGVDSVLPLVSVVELVLVDVDQLELLCS